MLQSVNVRLPQSVFERLQQVAQREQRSVVDTVEALVVQAGPFPSVRDEIERELFALASFPNEILVLLAENSISKGKQEELAELNYKVQQGGRLSQEEGQQQQELLHDYQQGILRRSYCLEILRRRNYGMSDLLRLPDDPVL